MPQCGEAGWISGAQLAVVVLPTGSVPENPPSHQTTCDGEVYVMNTDLFLFNFNTIIFSHSYAIILLGTGNVFYSM